MMERFEIPGGWWCGGVLCCVAVCCGVLCCLRWEVVMCFGCSVGVRCNGRRGCCGGRLSDDEDGDDGVASFMQALVGTVAGSGADGRMEGWRAGGLRG